MCEEKLVRVVASEVEEGGRIDREREERVGGKPKQFKLLPNLVFGAKCELSAAAASALAASKEDSTTSPQLCSPTLVRFTSRLLSHQE